MKKLFIIFSLFIFALGTQAQDITLDYNQTYLLYNGISTDVINTTDSTWTYEVWKKSDAPVSVYVDMLIDSTGGTANNVYIKLQHKRFVDLTYTTIDSVLWDGAGSELISFSPSSKTFTFTQTGGDTLTITSLAPDTVANVFNADSTITGTITRSNWQAVSNNITYSLTETQSDQTGLSGYFRILVEGTDNTIIAEIERLNWMFLKE